MLDVVPRSETAADDAFSVRVTLDGDRQVVHVTGALDMASRVAMVDGCVAGDSLQVVVDLAGVTFMDCSGYGALVRASRGLRGRGGSLTLVGEVGEPARLLSLLDRRER